MDPVNVNNPDLWRSLGAIFGPGGIPLLIGMAASMYFNLLQWRRAKEDKDECAKAVTESETRWEARFQQMRADVKEGFGIVAKLTEQVTILTRTH